MPIINVTIAARPDAARSRIIAAQVSELTRLHLKKDPTITAVVLHHVDPDHWFVGGRSLTEQNLSSFWLDIKVVDGTNTKTEMADYLEAVFTKVSAILGPTHQESYVLVHEVSAAAYGFGGKSQEYRFVSGRMVQEREAA
ncbi:MAG: tautomerase family protein [Beijerinckiaceae bacterium]